MSATQQRVVSVLSAWHRAVADYRALWQVNLQMGVVEDVFWHILHNDEAVRMLTYARNRQSLPAAGSQFTMSHNELRQIINMDKSVREGTACILKAHAPWWVWLNHENAQRYVEGQPLGATHVAAEAFDSVLMSLDSTAYDAVVTGPLPMPFATPT